MTDDRLQEMLWKCISIHRPAMARLDAALDTAFDEVRGDVADRIREKVLLALFDPREYDRRREDARFAAMTPRERAQEAFDRRGED